MDVSTRLPLDQGFLRRQCPECEREFKWHAGPTDDRPDDAVDPSVYWCPYCGITAPAGSWWTQAQIEFAKETIAGPAVKELADELQRSLGSGGTGLIKFSVDYQEPEPPAALQEPTDMVVVQSPCHPWEPIKIAEEWSAPIHCLVCGAEYALD